MHIKKFFDDNRVVLISIFTFTILCFGYYGVSTVINNDGVLDFIIDSSTNAGYKLYLSVGRWGWALLGLIFNYYPVPFLYLILNAILFSIATIYLSKIFAIEKTYQKILIGMLLISNPINAYAYAYSGWQNSIGIAFFLSIYGIYLLKNAINKKDYLLPILIFSFTISIYQMFLPFILILLVFLSIQSLIKNKNIKDFFKEVLKYFVAFILSCILYYIMVKLTTFIFSIEMTDYQNANNMFKFDLFEFINKFGVNFLNCFAINNLYFFPLISHIILIVSVVINFYLLLKNNQKKIGMMIILLLLLVIAPQIIRFVKYDQWFHTITLIPYCIFYAGNVALLYKNISNHKFEKYFTLIIVIVLLSFVIAINKAGVMAKNASNAAYYFANRLEMRIESLDGYTSLQGPKKYYFIGHYKFEEFPYSKRAYRFSTGITTNFVFNPLNLVDAINVMGMDVIYYNDIIDQNKEEEILASARNVGVYPEPDSIFIYDDIVVIKFTED